MAFTAQCSRRARTLLPRRPKDGQNRATTSGIRGLSVNVEGSVMSEERLGRGNRLRRNTSQKPS